jgi:hypothetical protein
MTAKKLFSLGITAAVFALTYFPPEKLLAQDQEGNRYSTIIGMGVGVGTDQEAWQTSQNGILQPAGLHLNEQIAVTISVTQNKKDFPVAFALLDGGQIFANTPLLIERHGLVEFAFEGGNTPGLYRVLMSIGAEEYLLQFYVSQRSLDCNP